LRMPETGLLLKFEFELVNTAVMGWVPAVKNGARQEAERTVELPVTGATGQEMGTAPGRASESVKVTVPSGTSDVPLLRKVMVAVSVTGWFTVEVFSADDDVMVTVVAPAPTDWTYAPAPDEGVALPAKFVSPLMYVAIMV